MILAHNKSHLCNHYSILWVMNIKKPKRIIGDIKIFNGWSEDITVFLSNCHFSDRISFFQPYGLAWFSIFLDKISHLRHTYFIFTRKPLKYAFIWHDKFLLKFIQTKIRECEICIRVWYIWWTLFSPSNWNALKSKIMGQAF